MSSPTVPTPVAENPDGAAGMIQAEYSALRGIAANHMRDERDCHTLTGTALANEVAAKMLNNNQTPTDNRGQFLTFANKAMRHYLVDYARSRRRIKRGGNLNRQPFQEDVHENNGQRSEATSVEEALQLLAEHNQRQADIVRLRFLHEQTNEQVAENLQISVATVKRDWHVARAWLASQIRNA